MPLAPQGCLEHPSPLTLAISLMRAGGGLASWDGGRGGGAVWNEGFLSSFVNPDSTLADGVQFDTGSAWGWLQEGSWSVRGSPSFQGKVGSWASPWNWRR